MSGAGSRVVALGVGLLALAAWIVALWVAPAAAVQGWLIGFVFVSSISIGSLAALLIHRLTAGAWGARFAPELAPAARLTPILLLFVLPVLFGLRLIYPWASDPLSIDPSVQRVLLNPVSFWIVTLLVLAGWSGAALSLRRMEAPGGRLLAGVALACHGIAANWICLPWIMSVVPSFTSSDFGMAFAVEQLMAAFAWAGLQARRRAADAVSGDVAGLLLATVIGLAYLEFMAFLIVWYGDRPPLDAWYLTRARWPWQVLSWFSLACGIVVVVLLAVRRAFATHRALALASGAALLGLLAYQTWLLVPSFGAACLGPEALALLAMGGLSLALAGGLPRLQARVEGLAHGR